MVLFCSTRALNNFAQNFVVKDELKKLQKRRDSLRNAPYFFICLLIFVPFLTHNMRKLAVAYQLQRFY